MNGVVVGMGSIGRRHFANLRNLGVSVVGVDLDNILPFDVDFAVICTPTNTHTDIVDRYLSEDIHLLVEKPISDNLNELAYLETSSLKSKSLTMVGCNLRFLDSIKSALHDNLGICNSKFSATVRNSNPKRGSYGHISLEDVHELDYLHYIFGEILSYSFKVLRNDYYVAEVEFEDGSNGIITGDSTSKEYTRNVIINGTPYVISPTNQMYVSEMEYFLSCLKLNQKPMNSISEACYVTRRILEALCGTNHSKPAWQHSVSEEDTSSD